MEVVPPSQDAPHRLPRGGLIAKSKVVERFEEFNRGEFVQLIRASVECDDQAAVSHRRKRRGGNDMEHRAIRALNLIQVGEFSSARHTRDRGNVVQIHKHFEAAEQVA